MSESAQNEVFSTLSLSKNEALREIAFLSASQKLAEFKSETLFFEKKYGKTFKAFDKIFKKKSSDFASENDWLVWKFAEASLRYWQNLIKRIHK